MSRRWRRATAPLLIAAAAAWLAAIWTCLVPVFQAPDETYHYDYTLCMSEYPGLYRSRDIPAVFPLYLVHPHSGHLWFATGADKVAQRWQVHVPANYGSAAFFRDLNGSAPPRLHPLPPKPPVFMAFYTYGYYGLLGLWVRCLRWLNDGEVMLFYGARLLSPLMLVTTLLLTYRLLRELHHGRKFALLFSACVGFFPMTSFVASYVQPDNLAFLLMTLCLLWTLRAQRKGWPAPTTLALGVGLAALGLTKQHFAICAYVPAAALLVSAWPGGWRRTLIRGVLLTMPALAAAGFYAWSVWGALPYYARSGGPRDVSGWLAAFGQAFSDFYCGNTHLSFWGIFGCMDTCLVIGSPHTTALWNLIIQGASWLVLGLSAARMEQVASRLWRLGRRGRPRLAARLACSNPVLNSYFLFTVLMFFLHMRTQNGIGAQGRNWLPVLPAVLLCTICYAPRALMLPRARRGLSAALGIALVVYVAIGSVAAVKTVAHRYYPADSQALARRSPTLLLPAVMLKTLWRL